MILLFFIAINALFGVEISEVDMANLIKNAS